MKDTKDEQTKEMTDTQTDKEDTKNKGVPDRGTMCQIEEQT